MSDYPNTIDTFTTKLNYSSSPYTIQNEPLVFEPYDDTTDRAMIAHSNPENIVVESTVVLTPDVDYTIITDQLRPWVKYISRLSSISDSWLVEYNTNGDENDSQDINDIHDSIVAIETTVTGHMDDDTHIHNQACLIATDNGTALGKETIACNGSFHDVVSFDNTAKTLTLNDVTGLAVGQLVIVQRRGSVALEGVEITALVDKTITLDTSETIDINWSGVIKEGITNDPTYAEGEGTLSTGSRSHSEGRYTVASGDSSHAEGDETLAKGASSHAEGTLTKALGPYSHSEGYSTTASGDYSSARGYTTLSSGTGSSAEGYLTQALGKGAHSEGTDTTATGEGAHSEGVLTEAQGDFAHSEGYQSLALGPYSHAQGHQTIASGAKSHSEGYASVAAGEYSHSEGDQTTARGTGSHSEGFKSHARGNYSHAEGSYTNAGNAIAHAEGEATFASYGTFIPIVSYDDVAKTLTLTDASSLVVGELIEIRRGNYEDTLGYSDIPIAAIDSNTITLTTELTIDATWTEVIKLLYESTHSTHAEGTLTVATGNSAHAEGYNTKSLGEYSHSEGYDTYASGRISHAEGDQAIARGEGSHAEGAGTIAEGLYAHSEGEDTIATGHASHSEGRETQATSSYSHAEGRNTTAEAYAAHSEGDYTIASGTESHAEGSLTVAQGSTSHSEGLETVALSRSAHSEGQYTVATDGYVYNVTAFDNVNKTLTLEVVTDLLVGDFVHIKITGAKASINKQITAINGNTITITTSLEITANWTQVIKPYETNSPSHAEGYSTLAAASYAHSEGNITQALGEYSHSEGNMCVTLGSASHSEGTLTKTEGNSAHSEGNETQALGECSHAEGSLSIAEGDFSHAEGVESHAMGENSHAEGEDTFTVGWASHAEGVGTMALSSGAHSEGYDTMADGSHSHSEGRQTVAFSRGSHAEGSYTLAIDGIMYNIVGFDDVNKTVTVEDATGLLVADEVTMKVNYGRPDSFIHILAITGNTVTLDTGMILDSECIALFKESETTDPSHAEGTNTLASRGGAHAEGERSWATGPSSHAEGYDTLAQGDSSHSEGENTMAFGSAGHSEGYSTESYGYASHAEGYNTVASGTHSHAEGRDSKSVGFISHAEGYSTLADGEASHSEGYGTTAFTPHTHSEGVFTLALNGESIPISDVDDVAKTLTLEDIGTIVVSDEILVFRTDNSPKGPYTVSAVAGNVITLDTTDTIETSWNLVTKLDDSLVDPAHSEGYNTLSSGASSHSEGMYNVVISTAGHVEGRGNSVYSSYSHAEGRDNTVGGWASHVEGAYSNAWGDTCHAEGEATSANAYGSHSEGISTSANGQASHAEGEGSVATGLDSHAQGRYTEASGSNSHAGGVGTVASVYGSTVIGRFNKALSGNATTYSGTADAFVIGNGPNDATLTNAFRVTFDGKVYGLAAFNSTGADYSEFFEWLDGNTIDEDRVGYFVTLDGEKIRKANSNDEYILGITSVNPAIIGDSHNDDWQGKYLTDAFGRIQYTMVTIPTTYKKKYHEAEYVNRLVSPAIFDSVGRLEEDAVYSQELIKEAYDELIIDIPEHEEKVPVINPDWDPTKVYIPREQRQEWSTVGMLGKLLVRDSGDCQVNSYCRPDDQGMATPSSTGYRVMKRVSDSIIQVLFR